MLPPTSVVPQAGFATGALTAIFFYWGWDVTMNLSEETRTGDSEQVSPAGKGAFWARRALAILLIGLGAVAGGFALLIDLWVGVAISALLSAVVAIAGHVRYRQDRSALRDAELSEIAV